MKSVALSIDERSPQGIASGHRATHHDRRPRAGRSAADGARARSRSRGQPRDRQPRLADPRLDRADHEPRAQRVVRALRSRASGCRVATADSTAPSRPASTCRAAPRTRSCCPRSDPPSPGSRTRERIDDVHELQAKPDIPELHDLLRETWPSPRRIDHRHQRSARRDRPHARRRSCGSATACVVENPTFPPFMDLLEHYGLEPIGVPLDDEGMRPEAFAAALGRGARRRAACSRGRTTPRASR